MVFLWSTLLHGVLIAVCVSLASPLFEAGEVAGAAVVPELAVSFETPPAVPNKDEAPLPKETPPEVLPNPVKPLRMSVEELDLPSDAMPPAEKEMVLVLVDSQDASQLASEAFEPSYTPSQPAASAKPTVKSAPESQPKPARRAPAAQSAKADARTTPPRPTVTKNPYYPLGAKTAGQHGTAYVRVTVSSGGRVQEVRIHRSTGNSSLDASALACVRGWRFAPALREGKPVAASALVKVSFRLSN